MSVVIININIILPYREKSVIIHGMLLLLLFIKNGNVNITIKYNKPNVNNNIVIKL